MAAKDAITRNTLDMQDMVFRIACDPIRYGLTLQSISIASDIPYSTLRGYANGTVEMPLSALNKLIGVVPDGLLTLLLAGERALVRFPSGLDHDEFATAVTEYLAAKNAMHHPDSPAGPALSDCERDKLNAKVAQFPMMGLVA